MRIVLWKADLWLGLNFARPEVTRFAPFRTFKAYQRCMFDNVMRFPSISCLTFIGSLLVATVSFASTTELTSDSTMLQMSTQELFVEGSILMEEGFWHEAERVWSVATERSPNNRVYKYKHGLCHLAIAEDWRMASEVLGEAVEGSLTSKYDPFNQRQSLPPFEALLFLAEAKRRLGEFSQAKTHIEKFNRKAGRKHNYAGLAEHMLADIDFAEGQLANPTSTGIMALNVNDDSDESRPMLTVDGRTLFFSSNRSRANGSNHGRREPNSLEHYDDVYRSHLLPDSTWSEPELLKLGASYHAVVVGTDAFGERVVLQDHDGWTYELKVSSQWERGWTASVPFILGKNQPTQGEVAFFPSKDRIIVSLQSRRGEGGFDLYECELDDRGRWSKPVSLGDEINSLGNEVSPFVAADGRTLFFASNGLPSVGGYDIHRAVRNADGSWGAPTPMGVPINSVEDEMSFVMGAKGEIGFFSSRRGDENRDLNLYEARMNRPSPIEDNVMVMSVDASEEDFIAGSLILRDLKSGATIQVVEKCAQSSLYKFIVPAGGEYVLERAATTNGAGGVTLPAMQRRISIAADAEPEIVDVAFADLFAPKMDGLDSDGLAGLELPPFTGSIQLVEPEVVGEVVSDVGVEDSAHADGVEPSEASSLNAEEVEEDVEEEEDAYETTTWTSNVMELSDLKGKWSGIQIGTFKNRPRDSWLLKAGDRFVVERLENGMTRWYAGVSQDPAETLAAHADLMAIGGFANSLLVRLDNGHRVLTNVDAAERFPTLVLREDSGLDGVAMTQVVSMVGTNMSAPICPLSLDDNLAGEMVLAIQFYSNQVHTGRMSIEPVVTRVLELAQEGKPQLRIEGSASSLQTSRPRGNEGLASDRAENVRYRLIQRLAYEGLNEGVDYEVEMVKRVQPDGRGLGMNAADVNPARHQYVRVDVELR